MTVNTTLPFELGQKAPSTVTEFDRLVGEFFAHRDSNGNPQMLRLMRLNNASGLSSAGALVFKLSNPSAAFDGDVEGVAATSDRPCGVSHADQVALDDNDFFLLIVEGQATVTYGDAGGSITAGHFVGPDDDADTGKVASTNTTYTRGTTIGKAIGANTGTDGEQSDVQILDRLLG